MTDSDIETAAGTTTAATQGTDGGASQTSSATFDTWDAYLAALPEDQRATVTKLYESQTHGLHTALEKERADRKAFEKQLRDAADKLEKGSADQQQLTKLADDLSLANRRADFYEDAARPELGLADVKAAWLIINAEPDDYINGRGKINFDLLKQNHPKLFGGPATPRTNAGSGTGSAGVAVKTDMNDMIRNAAGRG